MAIAASTYYYMDENNTHEGANLVLSGFQLRRMNLCQMKNNQVGSVGFWLD